LPASFGQSVIARTLAGKDGRRSQEVCPTLAPRFSFFQGAATGMKATAEYPRVRIASSALRVSYGIVIHDCELEAMRTQERCLL